MLTPPFPPDHPMRVRSHLSAVCVLAAMAAAGLGAQTPVATPLKFSGIIYADWQNGGTKAQRATNKFDLTRAYLTFIIPSGDNVLVRVTTDIYQNTNSSTTGAYYAGWAVRLKFAYMDWAAWTPTGTDRAAIHFRFGVVPTPEVLMMEDFWQRGLAPTPIDNFGFVSPSDLGAVAIMTLPGRQGEIYGGVFNGTSFAAAETDRFKNVNVRLSWTPLAASGDAGYLKGLQISPYYQMGQAASNFDPTGPGLQKDLWGIHVGIKNPKLTIAGEYDRRTDGADTKANGNVTNTAGAVYAASAIIRPLAYVRHTATDAWSLVLRADHYTPNTATSANRRLLIGGVGYDLSSKTSVYADFQDLEGHDGDSADSKSFFFHFVIGF